MNVLEYPSPEATATTTVYAVGDVHGRLDCLLEMHKLIARDIAARPDEKPLICYLGDYVDRGPESAGVIDALANLSAGGVARIFLCGNHEDRMKAFMTAPEENGPAWMKFGGREALESYGLKVPMVIETGDWPRLRDELERAMPQAHHAFLQQLRPAFRWRTYLFLHAGVDPAKPLSDQSERDLMWIREPFLSAETDYGCQVVHGHVIEPSPVFRSNRIGIDTGAYDSGVLTCLVLGDGGHRLLQTAMPK